MPEPVSFVLVARILRLALRFVQTAAEDGVAIGVVLAMLGGRGETLELPGLHVGPFQLLEQPAPGIDRRRLHLARQRAQSKPVDRDRRILVHRSPPLQLFPYLVSRLSGRKLSTKRPLPISTVTNASI